MQEDEFFIRLRKLCLDYDAKAGDHPESSLEGFAVYYYALHPDTKLDPPWYVIDSEYVEEGNEYLKDLKLLEEKKGE
jgi:hypothetical protein